MVKIDIEARSVKLRTFYEQDADGNPTEVARKHVISGKDEHGQPFSLKVPVATDGLRDLVGRFADEGAREARETALAAYKQLGSRIEALNHEIAKEYRATGKAIRQGKIPSDDEEPPAAGPAIAGEPASEDAGEAGDGAANPEGVPAEVPPQSA